MIDGDQDGPESESPSDSRSEGDSLPVRDDRDTDLLEGEIVDDAPAVPITEVRAIARREVRRAMLWIAPLPPPEEILAYRDADPELAIAIRNAFIQRTTSNEKILESEIRSIDRELTIKEREQDLRKTERDDDVLIRNRVTWFGIVVIPMWLLATFIVAMWGPGNGTSRALIVAAMLAVLTVPLVAVVLRGRMSDSEQAVFSTLTSRVNSGGEAAAQESQSDSALPSGNPTNAPID